MVDSWQDLHQANRAHWNRSARSGQGQKDHWRDWREVWSRPELGLDAQEWPWLEPVAGREVVLLGSGDNLAAFALAARGARVTSVDISEEQLAIAAARAAELGAAIRFVQGDVCHLPQLSDASCDLVHSGGHVAVWLADPAAAYAEAARLLRPGGRLVIGEYHPFRRLWSRQGGDFHLDTPYLARGPHRFEEDGLPSYEFHWTVSDLIRAATGSGLHLEHLEEYDDEAEAWERSDLRGLPRQLLIVARKPG